MSQRFTEFLIGLLFGVGLLLSGMTDPGKVIGFLDLAGNWDPSLAFVMGGAILVGIFAFAFAKRRTTDFFGGAIRWPTSNAIDRRLVIGSVVFGAGGGWPDFVPVRHSCHWVLACLRRSPSSAPCSRAWRFSSFSSVGDSRYVTPSVQQQVTGLHEDRAAHL